MSWGRGQGTLWGDDPVETVEQPLSEIGGGPTTFEFIDELDGPLPGYWDNYVLDYDGVGGVAWSAEPAPDAYFQVVGGLGLWSYARTPAVPGPAVPYREQGYAAGPRGVVEGRNLRVNVIFKQPVPLLDADADEFVFSVGVAARLSPLDASWVGARVRAEWAAGVWSVPLIVEALSADGGEETALSSVVPDVANIIDIWNTQDIAELVVELRGESLIAALSGIVELSEQVPVRDDTSLAVLVRAYHRYGSTIVPVPVVLGAQVFSLRDFERLGPPPQILGASHLEAPGFPMLRLPMLELLSAGFVKRVSGRQFEFVEDTEVTVQHQTYAFDQGEVVRIREKLTSQEFVPATRDLHITRSRKDR